MEFTWYLSIVVILLPPSHGFIMEPLFSEFPSLSVL